MGSTRNRPRNIVNTPMGPKRKGRIAGERMREDQARREFFAPSKDKKRRERLSGEESRDVFGQDFTESVKETEKPRQEIPEISERPTRRTPPPRQQEGRPRRRRERRPLYGPMSDEDRKKMEDKGLRRM